MLNTQLLDWTACIILMTMNSVMVIQKNTVVINVDEVVKKIQSQGGDRKDYWALSQVLPPQNSNHRFF